MMLEALSPSSIGPKDTTLDRSEDAGFRPGPSRTTAIETAKGPVLLNLGCGRRIDRRWRNLDLFPEAPGVVHANFLRGIPLRDAEADVVYHSHVLEHLSPAAARHFLTECRRVLRPGGYIRVVVPDLEHTVREYIAALDGRRHGTRPMEDHHWMLVELLDQLVRTSAGGAFASFVRERRGNDRFLLERLGADGASLLEAVRANGKSSRRGQFLRWLVQRLPSPWREAVGEAHFRTRGEVHKWMYDELSLVDLLAEVGFVKLSRTTHAESAIPDWTSYSLDASAEGQPWKPGSLYVEGTACGP